MYAKGVTETQYKMVNIFVTPIQLHVLSIFEPPSNANIYL